MQRGSGGSSEPLSLEIDSIWSLELIFLILSSILLFFVLSYI